MDGVIRSQARLRRVLEAPINWLRSITRAFNLAIWQKLSENNLLTRSLNSVFADPIYHVAMPARQEYL
jgi:hypothetical protein